LAYFLDLGDLFEKALLELGRPRLTEEQAIRRYVGHLAWLIVSGGISIRDGAQRISLRFNRMDIAADQGLTLFTYAAEPGSRSEQALNLLGSWAATTGVADPAQTTDQS